MGWLPRGTHRFHKLVKPGQIRAALREGGVYAELYLQRWRGHATMFLFGGSAEEQAIDFLDRVNRAD